MRNLAMSGIVVVCLGAFAACGLERDQDDLDTEAAQDELAPSEPGDTNAASDDTPDLNILATPTCNTRGILAPPSAPPVWLPFFRSANGATFTENCNMVQGTHSDGVLQLQRSMNLCYSEQLMPDSDFGPATRAALVRTQRKAGTPADGEYGPNTRRAMRHETPSGGCARSG
jgi:peptidoglycan hydrolase-like protein with peptidoglycan-binding domain